MKGSLPTAWVADCKAVVQLGHWQQPPPAQAALQSQFMMTCMPAAASRSLRCGLQSHNVGSPACVARPHTPLSYLRHWPFPRPNSTAVTTRLP